MTSSRRAFLRLLGMAPAGIVVAGVLDACGSTAPAAAPSTASAPATPASAASAKPAASAAAAAAAKPSGKPLVAAYPQLSAQDWPVWTANDTNAFADQGVPVGIKMVSNTAVVASLLSKEVDVLEISAATVIPAVLNGSVDVVFVGSQANRPPWAIYAKPPIQTAQDLKGKVIGTSMPGNPFDYGVRSALKLMGLQASDVTLVPIGVSDQLYPAMTAGKIDAAILSPPISFQAEVDGYKAIYELYSTVPYQAVGVAVMRSRLDELATVLPGYLKGLRKGIEVFNSQPDVAKQVLQKYTKEDHADVLQKSYDLFKDKLPFQLDLKPTTEGIQAVLDYFASTSIPAAKGVKAEQFIDLRFLNQIG